MTSRWWPLFDLRVRTARLELRLPGLAELDDLADLAAAGVHEADVMPFSTPWTDAPAQQRATSTLQWHWNQWAWWQPGRWNLEFVVVMDGVVVGTQGIGSREFPVRREVTTGSWLGRQFQRQGIGTEMRTAVLHFAFHGLGALSATSGAFADNRASLAVSRKLGYRADGIERQSVRGEVAIMRRLRLDRADWLEQAPSPPPEIIGLARCHHMFGLPSGDSHEHA